jgi:hypothetical protein
MAYELGAEIGRGRRHRVVRARLDGRGDEVALKCPLVPAAERNPLVVESKILARVVHPHVVRLVDVVRLDHDDRPLALALELARGGSLLDASSARQLPAGMIGPIALALSDALAEVHAAGFAHGDIKPANLLFRDDGAPVLADFDNASPLGTAPEGGVGSHRFSARYAAPEVVAGRRPDDRSDVWSLATVLLAVVDPGSPGAVDLISMLADATSIDPTRRPTASALHDHMAERFINTPFTPVSAVAVDRAVDDAPTCDWGPRPARIGAATTTTRSTRPVMAMATVGAVATVACTATAYVWSSTRDTADVVPSCGPADIAIDECVERIEWSTAEAVATVSGPDGDRRFAIGQPGDVLVVGDWDGDGHSSPGVYRPIDGTVHLFDSWAQGDDEIVSGAAHDTGVADGQPSVERVGDRDEVRVERVERVVDQRGG